MAEPTPQSVSPGAPQPAHVPDSLVYDFDLFHDAGLVARMLGEIPVAGFFCAGELGPVGGQNFLHAFTASIALFPDAAP